jgi:hypothetical protein
MWLCVFVSGVWAFTHVVCSMCVPMIMCGLLCVCVCACCCTPRPAQDCWHAVPRLRPSFTDIISRLEALLQRWSVQQPHAEAPAAGHAGQHVQAARTPGPAAAGQLGGAQPHAKGAGAAAAMIRGAA